jgi:hypothetical protein
MERIRMFKTFELLVIESNIAIVKWSVVIIVLIRAYGVRVWENNVMRKWVFKTLDLTLAQFTRFVSYLEDIEMHLQCRIAYTKITKPMKLHYRELTEKKSL